MQYKAFSAMVLAITLFTGSAFAAAVNVVTDNTNVVYTTGLTGFATTGADMSGMVVSADFSNGAAETLIWGPTGVGSGGVDGILFSLNETNDTFSSDWALVNKNPSGVLTKLTVNAGAGNTVFDIVDSLDPSISTEGSFRGRAFEEVSAPLGGSITALYSDPVALIGELPLGDLYAILMADFTELEIGGLREQFEFRFGADTDNLVLTAVPIPAALPLMLTALSILAFLGGWRRRPAI